MKPLLNPITSMRYQIIIELPTRANPGSPNHMEALLQNNKVKVLEVKEIDDV